MINCRKATRLLSDAQERNLTIWEKLVLRLHLSMCSACRNFGKQMGFIREFSKRYTKGHSHSGDDDSSETHTH